MAKIFFKQMSKSKQQLSVNKGINTSSNIENEGDLVVLSSGEGQEPVVIKHEKAIAQTK